MIKQQRSELDFFQRRVALWGERTFGKSTPESVLNHLAREVLELIKSKEPVEAADVFILLLHFSHKRGFSLMSEARKKFEINKKRKWRQPDEHGVVEHIRDEHECEIKKVELDPMQKKNRRFLLARGFRVI